jgi:hypothetical protein
MLFRGLFGTRPKSDDQSRNQQKTKQSSKQATPQKTKKIITPDEGEYIDFEEIKD